MPTDIELLEAWRAGDKDAGRSLFKRHYAAVTRFFRNKAGYEESEDLVQKTFLACVESKDRFRGDSSVRTYLFGIAYRKLCRHYQQRQRQQRQRDKLDFGVQSVRELAPTASQVVARRREQRALLEALRRIPLQHQTILELYYWEHMTAAGIAVALELPLGTVKSRLRRAKQLVREQLLALADDPKLLESTQQQLDDWATELRQLVDTPERTS